MAVGLSFFAGAAIAAPKQTLPTSKVNFPAFLEVSKEASTHRQKRMVDLDTFLKMSQEKNTLILDTRSESAFKRKHIKGSKHLNFSDFTTEKLKKVIPTKTTRILIYCNNNLDDDPTNFPTKIQPMALNIPTFINLYGYGYKNIYELSSLVSVKNPKLQFEGTDISTQ